MMLVNFKFTGPEPPSYPSAKGDLATDNLVCTLPVGWRPIRSHWCSYAIGGSSFGEATLEATGQLRMLNMLPDTQISNGNYVAGTLAFSSAT